MKELIAEIRNKCVRMKESQSLCEQVPRRVEAAVAQDPRIIANASTANQLESVLGDFSAYLDGHLAQPQSLLYRLGAYQSILDAVQLAHQALDVILKDDTSQWQQDVEYSRELQQQWLKQHLDQARLTVNDRDIMDQVLKSFKAMTQRKRSAKTELEWINTIYFKLFRLRKTLPSDVPEWFIAANDVQIDASRSSIDLGLCGEVYSGMWRRGTRVSIRRMPINTVNTKAMMKEADLWSKLNHPHVMKLFGACHEDQPFFVCEDVVPGHLGDFLSKPQNRQKTWRMLFEASLGLYYLHSQRIVHGDLRCRNIRIGADGKAKLGNFSYSVKLDEVSSDTVITDASSKRWKAPECLEGSAQSAAADIYSFGMCIIEATTGKPPWPLSEELKNLVSSGHLPSQLDNASCQLVQQMCAREPTTRPSVVSVADDLRRMMRKEAAAAELSASKESKLCTSCGNSMSDSANFCNKCGKSVGDRLNRVASCA